MNKKADPRREANRRAQWNKGLAEMALLCLLRPAPLYGLEILDRLNGKAGLDVAEGSIYPLLHRLEAAGHVAAQWRTETENGRPRKYYAITPAGRAAATAMVAEWQQTRARLDALIKETGDDKQRR